jgi:S-adenosylmethionine decarboxylase
MSALGMHVLADLSEIDPARLRDEASIERILTDAAREAGATVLDAHFHRFGGAGGVTGVVLLAESHITIHTWPEYGIAALDAFMCGRADARRAIDLIARTLGARVVQRVVERRGAAKTGLAASPANASINGDDGGRG